MAILLSPGTAVLRIHQLTGLQTLRARQQSPRLPAEHFSSTFQRQTAWKAQIEERRRIAREELALAAEAECTFTPHTVRVSAFRCLGGK